MNVLFVKTIQSHIKRNTYMDRCVKYSNLRIWITLFISQNSTTYAPLDWNENNPELKEKIFEIQRKDRLV